MRDGVTVLDSTISGRFSGLVFDDRAVALTIPAHEVSGHLSLPAIDPAQVVEAVLDADPLPLTPEKPFQIALGPSATSRRLIIYLREGK